MRFLMIVACLFLSTCFNHKVGGKVEHEGTISGQTEVVIRIDISGCMEFTEDAAKLECIKAIVDAMTELNKSAVIAACIKASPEDLEQCFKGSQDEVITMIQHDQNL